MTKCLEILRKKCQKNSENARNFKFPKLVRDFHFIFAIVFIVRSWLRASRRATRVPVDMFQRAASGADKVSLNTAAIINPNLIDQASSKFGNQCIVVAIDAKADPEDRSWRVYTHGGRKPTELDAVDWAKEVASRGAGEILLTSMDRDGTKIGFDLDLTRTVSEAVEIPVIASGGVGTLHHLVEGVREGKASAVLAASIFHFGEFTVGQAQQALADAGIPARTPSR